MPGKFSIETHSGAPYQTDWATVTPFSQSVLFRIPGFRGGFVWNRPVSVLVRQADGQESILPVADITRRVQIGLAGMLLFTLMLAGIVQQMRRR
jgi:hypothetical protein